MLVMEKRYFEEMKRKIALMEEQKRLDGKHIVLFGHTEATEKMIDELLLLGKKPESIADNNKEKEGFSYRGIKVKNPMDALSECDKETIILIASRAYENMKEQCIGLGYRNIIKVVDYNTFADFSLSDEVMESKIKRLIRGFQILDELREDYPDYYIAVCPYNAMGDVYEAMRYFPVYREKKQISQFAVIVQGSAARQVAEMFGVENIVDFDPEQMDELQQAVIYRQNDMAEILHHDRPFYTNLVVRLADHCKVTFDELYRIGVYGLSVDETGMTPIRRPPKEFSELVKGKSVILAPYARSIISMSNEFWIEKVKELSARGFYVYTNVVGEEKPIDGTEPVTYAVSDMINAVEYGGRFVGIRSGLCDIVQSADCEKEVIYPECVYSTTNMMVKEFFEIGNGG